MMMTMMMATTMMLLICDDDDDDDDDDYERVWWKSQLWHRCQPAMLCWRIFQAQESETRCVRWEGSLGVSVCKVGRVGDPLWVGGWCNPNEGVGHHHHHHHHQYWGRGGMLQS